MMERELIVTKTERTDRQPGRKTPLRGTGVCDRGGWEGRYDAL